MGFKRPRVRISTLGPKKFRFLTEMVENRNFLSFSVPSYFPSHPHVLNPCWMGDLFTNKISLILQSASFNRDAIRDILRKFALNHNFLSPVPLLWSLTSKKGVLPFSALYSPALGIHLAHCILPSHPGRCIEAVLYEEQILFVYFALHITPQAIFVPAFPAGWERKSSVPSWITMVFPMISFTEKWSVHTAKKAQSP